MDKFTIIDSYLGQNEVPIRTEKELRDQLQSVLKTGTNQIITLHSAESGDLTLGIGKPYGFVEYMDNTQKHPFLIATDHSVERAAEYYEFDSGGTATPIPAGNCIMMDRVFDIAIYFFTHSKIPKDVNWEEE